MQTHKKLLHIIYGITCYDLGYKSIVVRHLQPFNTPSISMTNCRPPLDWKWAVSCDLPSIYTVLQYVLKNTRVRATRGRHIETLSAEDRRLSAMLCKQRISYIVASVLWLSATAQTYIKIYCIVTIDSSNAFPKCFVEQGNFTQ